MMYKLLSHTDLDGVSCGILAKLAFGKDINVRYNSVSALDQNVKWFLENEDKSTTLWITDLSVNEENEQKLNEFYNEDGKVQLIDHHKTALHFNDYEWGHVKVEDQEGHLCSATSLLYDYLLNHNYLSPKSSISEYVELVRQYDTWEWEANNNQQAKRLNALFFLVSIDEFEEMMVERLSKQEHFSFDEFEDRILTMEENKIERYIRRKRRELVQIQVGENFAGVVYAESYHSELGNELGKDYPHLDYITIINMGAKRVGFRTIHDHIDVSEIAGLYGGGGHAKASGCLLTEEAYKQFVLDTFHLEPLHEDARFNKYNLKKSPFGSLYKNRMNDIFFLYPENEYTWAIESNELKMDETFYSFEEAEKYLKRTYGVWLLRDQDFVNYLMAFRKKMKEQEEI